MNLEILRHAKGYLNKLANGINPLTGESVPESDIINNVRISRCLFYVSDVLEEVLANGGVHKSAKVPFYLSREIINNYEFTNEDLSISRIVKKINELKTSDNMDKLKVSDMCKWLMSIGLLKEIEDNGKRVKIPTEMGQKMGMYVEHRIVPYREYDVVIYKKSMQEFIIDNFESLLDFINNN